MTDYREILRQNALRINNSMIAESTMVARSTVIRVLQLAKEKGVVWETARNLTDKELAQILYPQATEALNYRMPDYKEVHQEMAKSGVTLSLLWFEYCDRCRAAGEIPYQITQFKKYYHDYVVINKATMHLTRKPGEIMEVDYAGQSAKIVNSTTGESIDVDIFVAVLPYSGYAYVEGALNRNQESWTAAHVNAYRFFGGVTRILVPDNLKTGVIKHSRSEVILNKTYHEMAEHYGTAIIPARVRAPKDKATVEATVGNISTWILAAIRNRQFFSLKELNTTIQELLYEFNHKGFQKKSGSRASLFEEEREFLLPLPTREFELADWKTATVQYNYHVDIDGQHYSVPFEYIKRVVNVRLTLRVVEVFLEDMRIASHARRHGYKGQYSTLDEHMPPNHQEYSQWNGMRFRSWALKIGTQTATVIETMLTGRKVEQQAYKTCMALLKMSEQFTPERLEAACGRALNYSPHPSYKSVQSILKSGLDKLSQSEAPLPEPELGLIRSADYDDGGADNA
jgi:transposase